MRPHAILERAAEQFGVSIADLTGKSQTRRVVRARCAAAWAIRRRCPALSLAEIGQLLGGREHSTIHSAIQRAETLMRHDEDFRAQVWALLDERPARAHQTPVRESGEAWWAARAYWWPHTTPAA